MVMTSTEIRQSRDTLRGLWQQARDLHARAELAKQEGATAAEIEELERAHEGAVARAKAAAGEHRENVDDAVRATNDRENRTHLGRAVERLCDALAQRPTTGGSTHADEALRILEALADSVEAEVESWDTRHSADRRGDAELFLIRTFAQAERHVATVARDIADRAVGTYSHWAQP